MIRLTEASSEWKPIHAIILVISIAIILSVFGYYTSQPQTEYEERLWWCMDGCYNMLEVTLGNVSDRHVVVWDECADMCIENLQEEG